MRTLIAFLVLGAIFGGSAGYAHAQSGTPNLEGTSPQCQAVSYWFADGIARMAQSKGNAPGVEPRLTLFNGRDEAQLVELTLRLEGGGTRHHQVNLPPRTRRALDLRTLLLVDTDFSLEVDFQSLGAAELRIWTGNSPLFGSTPLPLCR